MITDKLSGASGSGRDFIWILKNLKEVIKKQGTDESAISALQTQIQNLIESGQMTAAEIGTALIHNLTTDGINTSKVVTIRGITEPGNWVIGWYGNNVPYQYRPAIDVSGQVQTQEDVLNIPAGTDVEINGTIPGSSNVVSTAGGPSIVMLSCGQPNQEAQICALWTDKSIAVLYSQNVTNLPYISIGVDTDPNTLNPCLILEINPAFYDSFPGAEIIFSSWALNFSPNNNAYKFNAVPKYRSVLAGESGFAMSAFTLPGNFNFENIGVDEAVINMANIVDLEANTAKVNGSPVVTETILDTTVTALQTAIDGKVAKAGDTMTGALTLNGAPTADNMASNKKYVDDKVAAVESNALTFKGFISTTEPAIDLREGNLWYQPSSAETTPDVSFPWAVKTYTSGAWSTSTTDYIPTAGDRWANVDDNSSGWYYEGQAWHKLDFGGSVFNADQFDTSGGEVSLKAGSVTDNEIPINADIAQSKIAGLADSLASKQDNIAVVGTSNFLTAPAVAGGQPGIIAPDEILKMIIMPGKVTYGFIDDETILALWRQIRADGRTIPITDPRAERLLQYCLIPYATASANTAIKGMYLTNDGFADKAAFAAAGKARADPADGGAYLAIPCLDGLFIRGAGQFVGETSSNNTPYDGKEPGSFETDRIQNITGKTGLFAIPGRTPASGALYFNNETANVWSTGGSSNSAFSLNFDSSLSVRTGHETAPAAISVFACISY